MFRIMSMSSLNFSVFQTIPKCSPSIYKTNHEVSESRDQILTVRTRILCHQFSHLEAAKIIKIRKDKHL